MTGNIEVWASPEPTIARIDATRVRNQLVETGHFEREDDIDLLASLGVSATRYPVLWEAIAPIEPESRDFSWSDRRMAALRAHGVDVVPTLMHHGCGPRYTNLLDPEFPQLFASFAAAAAERYPWVRRWTPINEPLTTARFSTLYGTWYPNGSWDHEAFGRAIFNEALGTLLAMHAIRRHIPFAELVLTEDLQHFIAADARVGEYVAHKLERRFLSAELILGRVTRDHSLWEYLTQTCRLAVRDLERLRRLAFPISLMGWNYYPNSERVLFSNSAGPDGNVALVDVDSKRMSCSDRLIEAWDRLKVPMALTEVHCMGNEADRSRWMLQRYADLVHVQRRGVDVRAFGAWAAFGMIDWKSLLCLNEDSREDGVFTCARPSEPPVPTRVASVVRELAAGRVPAMPKSPGWWEGRCDAVA